VFSNNKLFLSFLQEICAQKLKINHAFSKSLLLIITDGRIRRMELDKMPCFYHAVLAPQASVTVLIISIIRCLVHSG